METAPLPAGIMNAYQAARQMTGRILAQQSPVTASYQDIPRRERIGSWLLPIGVGILFRHRLLQWGPLIPLGALALLHREFVCLAHHHALVKKYAVVTQAMGAKQDEIREQNYPGSQEKCAIYVLDQVKILLSRAPTTDVSVRKYRALGFVGSVLLTAALCHQSEYSTEAVIGAVSLMAFAQIRQMVAGVEHYTFNKKLATRIENVIQNHISPKRKQFT